MRGSAVFLSRSDDPIVPAIAGIDTARATTEILPLSPRNALAVALDYLPGQRASLTRCVTTPGAYPDNNGLSEKRCRRARCALGLKALPTRTVPRGPLDR